MHILSPTLLCLFLLGVAPASAAPCDKLSGEQRKMAQQLFKTTHPHDCCDETLDRCLKAKKVCRLAKRLRDDICRRVKRGDRPEKIKSALARRAKSMVTLGKRAVINLKGVRAVGNAKGPVQVVVYACARCPYCRQVVPGLYKLATKGKLKGQLALYFRPFPIRGHAGSVEGGLAFIAAQQQGKLWPYLLHLFKEFDHFSVKKLPEWAAKVGLVRADFARALKDPAVRKQLVVAKKEGLRNGVDSTPTIFIDGRKYHGELEQAALADVLGEAVDRALKRRF